MSARPGNGAVLANAFGQALVRLHLRMLRPGRSNGFGAPDGPDAPEDRAAADVPGAPDGRRAPDGPEAPDASAIALALWGPRLWQATAEGHACLIIADPRQREALAASPAVALVRSTVQGAEPPESSRTLEPADLGEPPEVPLILEGDALYLQRLWRAESTLAALLVALDAPAPLADAEALETVLAQVAPPDQVDEQQRAAMLAALSRRLSIVTGGPGTGKTTTMARLLVAFSRLAPTARIAIAAPTGKAAARLAQALAGQLETLAPGGELAARLPASGVTVHRLLGLRGDDSRPAPGALRHDLVIVDEASMLDLELACALLESIPPGGRLVLAGDQHQLASVEAGAVFAEACASALTGIVTLDRNYRQRAAPALAALASWLRAGCRDAEGGRVPAPFDASGHTERHAPAGAEAIAIRALETWEPAFLAVDGDALAVPVLSAFDGHRVLCAMREGPLGVVALNALIAARARRRVGARPGAVWYRGRIVIVTRNRPELALSNGDVGVCLRDPCDPEALAVAFDTGGDIRWLPVRQMPAHEDAFAMTVHKSQGSEFGSVALVPAPRGHPLNTRELLYTGATRARRHLLIWADAATLDEGGAQRTSRHGRLADRILALHPAHGGEPR